MSLDPRLNAFRPDLADRRLASKVEADRFVAGTLRQIIDPLVNVYAEPRSDAQCTSQALYGERLTVFEDREGWAWCQLQQDRYVGYLSSDTLTDQLTEPTHTVSALSTYLYTAPGIKTQPVIAIYMNSKVTVVETDGNFARLSDGRYIWASHLTPIGPVTEDPTGDPATIAERFQHVPYLWGGKSQAGLDCSGLVQLSYNAAGKACPRDSDMMQETIGEPLLINDVASLEFGNLQRGDLVFWQGHIGMMLDPTRIVHANGHHMTTVIEPLAEAVDRIARLFGPVTGFRRP